MNKREGNNRAENELKKLYDQLALDFDDEFSVSPIKPFEIPDRIYSFPELLKHPFFLNKKSKAVTKSRKIYNEKQIRKRMRNKKKRNGEPYYTDDEISNAVKVGRSDLVQEYQEGWQIIANAEYGLPNETDGHVWDYIQSKVSDIFLSQGKFHSLYFFTDEEIVQELIRVGVFSGRGGKQTKTVQDAISRLFRTIYRYEKGITVKTKKGDREVVNTAEFTLLSAVFKSGQKLPDGKTYDKTALAINPVVLKSLREDHFFIISNKKRQTLKRYAAKVLYDRLAFWAFINHNNKNLLPLQDLDIPPYQVIGYEKICILLGLEPLKGATLKKSRVEKQLNEVHQELIENQVVKWVEVDEVKEGRGKRFRLVYAYNDDFVKDVLSFLSQNKQKEQQLESEQFQLDIDGMDKVLKRLNVRIKDQRIKDKLLGDLLKISKNAERGGEG